VRWFARERERERDMAIEGARISPPGCRGGSRPHLVVGSILFFFFFWFAGNVVGGGWWPAALLAGGGQWISLVA
jgi:hypothetical protein